MIVVVSSLWCSDTFNENRPPTDDPSYISSLGAIVYKAMNAGDQDAIWLMQASLIILILVVILFLLVLDDIQTQDPVLHWNAMEIYLFI